MYCITYNNNYYFHSKGRIILFNDIQTANDFASQFLSWSLQYGAQQFGPTIVFEIMQSQNNIKFESYIPSKDIKTITYQQLRKEYNYD